MWDICNAYSWNNISYKNIKYRNDVQMISFLSNWAEQLIIAIVICSIIEMILPDNKNKKYIKIVIGIYILFTIISPLVNKEDLFDMDSFDIESYVDTDTSGSIQSSEKINQTSMDERLQELYVQELENNIKAKVKQEGYNAISCNVDAVLYGDEENQEIKKVSLVVSKDINENVSNSQSSMYNANDNSNVKSINKVEINVGMDKILGKKDDTDVNDDEQSNVKDIQYLKNVLSSYYEIDSKKIHISVK